MPAVSSPILRKPLPRPPFLVVAPFMSATMAQGRREVTEKTSAPAESQAPEKRYTPEAVAAEMTERVRTLASLASDDGRKAAIGFVAAVLGLPFGKVKRLFYGEVRGVPAHEADKIRAYCEAAAELIQARADYVAQRREFLASAGPIMARLAPPQASGTHIPEDRAQAPIRAAVCSGRRSAGGRSTRGRN